MYTLVYLYFLFHIQLIKILKVLVKVFYKISSHTSPILHSIYILTHFVKKRNNSYRVFFRFSPADGIFCVADKSKNQYNKSIMPSISDFSITRILLKGRFTRMNSVCTKRNEHQPVSRSGTKKAGVRPETEGGGLCVIILLLEVSTVQHTAYILAVPESITLRNACMMLFQFPAGMGI